MILYAIWETILWGFFMVRVVIPILVKFLSFAVGGPIKFSLLHLTTLFKGWIPVATAMAATWLLEGQAIGKYPQNPPERVYSALLTNAHMTIGAGALINIFILVAWIWLVT